VVEVGLEVEHATRVDDPGEHVREQLRDVLAGRGDPALVQVRASIRRLVAAMSDVSAFVGNGRLDILYANPHWETNMQVSVAALRGEAGRNPCDRALSDLVALLSTRSEEFRVAWARHDVRFHRSGTKRVHHPLVGDLTLSYERLEPPADPGFAIVTYSAEPGSRSESALQGLAEWSAARTRLMLTEAITK
jgi:hypothetical protein